MILIDDCWLLYVYAYNSTYRWYYWFFLFLLCTVCTYSMVFCLFCRVCKYSMVYSHIIISKLHGRTTKYVKQLIALFASLFILLLLNVIYDCVGKYDETIKMDWYVGQWCWIMLTYLLNLLKLLQCPFPSFLSRDIIAIFSFQVITYLLVVVLVIYIYIYIGAIYSWYYMIVSCWYGW